jgi:hypothetical protein
MLMRNLNRNKCLYNRASLIVKLIERKLIMVIKFDDNIQHFIPKMFTESTNKIMPFKNEMISIS